MNTSPATAAFSPARINRPPARQKRAHWLAGSLLGLAAAMTAGILHCGGTLAKTLPDEVKEAAAEASYLGQMLRCVDENKDRPIEHERTCREGVRRRWCVDSAGNVNCKDGGGSDVR